MITAFNPHFIKPVVPNRSPCLLRLGHVMMTSGIRAVTLVGGVGVNIRPTVLSGVAPASPPKGHQDFSAPLWTILLILRHQAGRSWTWHSVQRPGRKRSEGFLGTRASAQWTVWVSRCFLVSLGRFCERGMMCILCRGRLCSGRWPVFIAGLRLSDMVMKAGVQLRSTAPRCRPSSPAPTFVSVCVDVFVLECN